VLEQIMPEMLLPNAFKENYKEYQESNDNKSRSEQKERMKMVESGVPDSFLVYVTPSL
jgi:hypothetical protein